MSGRYETEGVLDKLSDENEDERRDFQDPARDPFESEHGPAMGTDGDDNPEYVRPKQPIHGSGRAMKVKLKDGNHSRIEILAPGDIKDPAGGSRVPAKNPAGEMVAAGHGFVVKDERSRPWKTAKRTNCAYCGGEMPAPDASRYLCEFAPFEGCQCSGCNLQRQVTNGSERNRGQPRKYCSKDCSRRADNERKAWKRAITRAEKRGEQPPAEPEDRGLKFVMRHGPRSSSEGSCSRA